MATPTKRTTHKEIPGWGADLDHANRPAYPKERTPQRYVDVPWSDPEPQEQNVEILKSVEHARMPPVFGTSSPPSGLSGVIRRVAFKASENDIRHWLLLLFADRVNMVEGLVQDLARGHIPNVFAEMGWKAKFKYNKKGAIIQLASIGAVVGLGAYLISRKRTNANLQRSAAKKTKQRKVREAAGYTSSMKTAVQKHAGEFAG